MTQSENYFGKMYPPPPPELDLKKANSSDMFIHVITGTKLKPLVSFYTP